MKNLILSLLTVIAITLVLITCFYLDLNPSIKSIMVVCFATIGVLAHGEAWHRNAQVEAL